MEKGVSGESEQAEKSQEGFRSTPEAMAPALANVSEHSSEALIDFKIDVQTSLNHGHPVTPGTYLPWHTSMVLLSRPRSFIKEQGF